MKKEDFKKGQTVFLYLIGNAARGRETINERIVESEVISVGRKYIIVRGLYSSSNIKFDIFNDFKEVYTFGTADYELYLSKNDLLQEVNKSSMIRYIEQQASWQQNILSQMSIEDLEKIYSIFKKYEKK